MQKGLFYIILSFVLTLAVTEYAWVELLREKQVVAELETEEKIEADQKEPLPTGEQLSFGFFSSQGQSFSFKNDYDAFAAEGNHLRSVVKCNSPKLFILHQQLRVHC